MFFQVDERNDKGKPVARQGRKAVSLWADVVMAG